MPVTAESISNFRAGFIGTACVGVLNLETNEIHLSLGEGAAAECPRSRIRGVERGVLPRRGGHAQLAQWAGIVARQLGTGLAEGNAAGFTIQKNAPRAYTIESWLSGLNRPTREMPDELRPLIVAILNTGLTGPMPAGGCTIL